MRRTPLIGAVLATIAVAGCTASRPIEPAPRPSRATHSSASPRISPGPPRVVGGTRFGARGVVAAVSTSCSRSSGCTDLWLSRDTGRHWRLLHTPPRLGTDLELAFADARNGWVVSVSAASESGMLYVTHDGGRTWTPTELSDASAVLVSATHVYAVAGMGRIYAGTITADSLAFVARGGTALTPTRDGVVAFVGRPAIAPGTGRAVVIRGSTVVRRLRLPRPGQLWSAAVADNDAGGLVAVIGSEPGTGLQRKWAYRSSDDGRTWRRIPAPNLSGYVQTAASGAAGVFVGGGRMSLAILPRDHSRWHTAIAGSGDDSGVTPIGFTDAQHGWAVDFGAALYLTENGGQTWRPASVP